MVDRKALLRHGSLVGCKTHNHKRQWKTKAAKPKHKCPVCWACWVADRLQCSVYDDDLKDLLTFSNAFLKTVKASSVEFIETGKDET